MSRPRRAVARMLILILLGVAMPRPGLGGPDPGPALKITAPVTGYSCAVGTPVDLVIWTRPGLQVSQVTVLDQDGAGLGVSDRAPYVVHWDTSRAAPGSYTLRAQVHLEDGRSLDSAPVQVTLKPAPGPAGSVLKESTPVLLATDEKMVSGEIPQGSTVRLHADRDVLGPEGEVLIPSGATANGKVVKSEGSGFFGAAGELNFTLDTVTAADGTVVPLRAFRDATGDDAEGGVIAGAVLLSIFFVFMTGDDVEIPAGTVFTGYVAHDARIPEPAPSKLTEIDRSAAVSMIDPVSGARLERDDQVTFSCTTTPPDDRAYVRLFLDGTLVASQQGNLSKIVWDAGRNDELRDRLQTVGPHKAEVEVTFSTGRLVRSAPVDFSFVD